MEERIIGIDLGTTNSLSATVFEDGPEVICLDHENPITPSLLCHDGEKWIVGEEAKPYRFSNPESTVYSVKRLMGRDISEVEAELEQLPYQVVAAQRKLVKVRLGQREFTPQEVSAEILKKVKQRAEQALGQTVTKAVITVPAYFDDAQRQATRDAAKIAGLDAVRIINEPTAAAIAYGLDEKKEGIVVVYDLGGGTFDVSVLSLTGKLFKVVSTHGDTRLGGDDFDQALTGYFHKKILEKYPEISLVDSFARQTLKDAAETIKFRLSTQPETTYHIELADRKIHVDGTITVEEFNAMIDPWIQKTILSCGHALRNAGISVAEVDDIVMVGGSTVIPYVRKKVTEFFGKKLHVAIDPYKVVAIGAGIQGHLLAGGRRDFLLLDVIPLSLGIETLGGTFSKLIMQNTTIPTQASEMFTTHVDNQTAIDINIYQGERELVSDCRYLGQFKLRGIPPMPGGLPLMEVTFKVDANGILTVSALEKRSGQQTEIEIIPFHGLTRREIDKIMEDSFEHAMEDFKNRQLIEFRQTVDRVLGGIRKFWDLAEKTLSPEKLEAIRQQMDVVLTASKGEDPQYLKQEMDRLGENTRVLADTAIGQQVLRELKKADELSSPAKE
ncbi:MAG: Fe-S protein assembly chaperone HscA [SAR324 cluster bacterium]|nr:Fe-S protein assembly chaperone HscA [SAR324 cluster bacterium]